MVMEASVTADYTVDVHSTVPVLSHSTVLIHSTVLHPALVAPLFPKSLSKFTSDCCIRPIPAFVEWRFAHLLDSLFRYHTLSKSMYIHSVIRSGCRGLVTAWAFIAINVSRCFPWVTKYHGLNCSLWHLFPTQYLRGFSSFSSLSSSSIGPPLCLPLSNLAFPSFRLAPVATLW